MEITKCIKRSHGPNCGVPGWRILVQITPFLQDFGIEIRVGVHSEHYGTGSSIFDTK